MRVLRLAVFGLGAESSKVSWLWAGLKLCFKERVEARGYLLALARAEADFFSITTRKGSTFYRARLVVECRGCSGDLRPKKEWVGKELGVFGAKVGPVIEALPPAGTAERTYFLGHRDV